MTQWWLFLFCALWFLNWHLNNCLNIKNNQLKFIIVNNINNKIHIEIKPFCQTEFRKNIYVIKHFSKIGIYYPEKKERGKHTNRLSLLKSTNNSDVLRNIRVIFYIFLFFKKRVNLNSRTLSYVSKVIFQRFHFFSLFSS